jgi:hypothetical protein
MTTSFATFSPTPASLFPNMRPHLLALLPQLRRLLESLLPMRRRPQPLPPFLPKSRRHHLLPLTSPLRLRAPRRPQPLPTLLCLPKLRRRRRTLQYLCRRTQPFLRLRHHPSVRPVDPL